MSDELTGAEPKVISASFANPYILLIRDDASVFLLKCDESGDLEEVERSDSLLATRWLSGGLYQDRNSRFGPRYMNGPNKGGREPANLMMFLLSADGGLQVSLTQLVILIAGSLTQSQVYNITSLDCPVWATDSLSFLPPQLSSDDCVTNRHTVKRSTNQPRETITEILVADIGDAVRTEPYLMVSTCARELYTVSC